MTNDTAATNGETSFEHQAGIVAWTLNTTSMRLRFGDQQAAANVTNDTTSTAVVFAPNEPTIVLPTEWYKSFSSVLPVSADQLDCDADNICVFPNAFCYQITDEFPYLEFVIEGIRYVVSPDGYTFDVPEQGCAIAVSGATSEADPPFGFASQVILGQPFLRQFSVYFAQSQ